MKITQIGKFKFCAWGCWWLERTCDMSTDVLARAFLLCIAIFWNKHANDSVIYIVIIHRVSPVVTVYLL